MIRVKDDSCDFCGVCVSVCPTDAIELRESVLIIDEEKCTECQNCVYVCPIETLEYVS
ncbi:4Fe-4S ferredoxin [candidate division KSB1 bacterium]|mgnify:CR=1 FL=1|nr:4Fe-4S binding protein [bacterium]OQX57942.1 MAG: 4Fe-4S ferredoxin [candidate division KSB1 bacterium 4484_219]RKY79824.1 MAG: 4Fe-4S ferredoxin [candidate division KSB1 bacterium]HDI51661.1 4Fe-4S dicluster domain-containing protein [Bacteroidota bacterium]RKY80740.1 MAG: 4Fe-4S ferredoxin [candidate division KSB1 bacterium]